MAQLARSEKARPLLTNGQSLQTAVKGRTGTPPGNVYYPVDLPEAVDVLAPEADALVAYFRNLPENLRDDRLYVEALIRPNFISASNFPRVLFAEANAIQVGTRVAETAFVQRTRTIESERTKSIVLSVSPEGLSKLPMLLRRAGASQLDSDLGTDIKKIEHFMLPHFDNGAFGDEVGADEMVTLEAVLNPQISPSGSKQPVSQDVIAKFREYVGVFDGELVDEYVRVVGKLTFVPVRVRSSVAPELHRFNPLRSLRPMPVLNRPSEFGLRSVSFAMAGPDLSPMNADLSVGVFDGGIGSRGAGSKFFPSLDIDITSETETDEYTDHGTAVVGAVRYGLVDIDDTVARPPLEVESYRMFPPKGIPGDLYCYWVLDRIKEIVEAGTHNIYNLSLGPKLPVREKSVPNRWTSELDELAWERQILLVVAAGNDGNVPSQHGRNRVQAPADAINVLSVGSVDLAEPSKGWVRAPYSSVGPGRYGGRVQPVVVQAGGTAATPLPLLMADGQIRHDRGTSFSTGLVTHAMAGLANRLGAANANTLRAFAVHFAERPRPQRLINEVGYGRAPLTFDQSLECGPDQAHVLYEDRLFRKVNVAYEIPLPSGFTSRLAVRTSLSFAAPTDPDDAMEYSKAALEFTLRPDERMYRYTAPSPIVAHEILRRGTDRAVSLQDAGWKESRHPISQSTNRVQSGERGERWLRDQGKWETTRVASFILEPGTYFKPRLHMTYLAREGGVLVDDAPPIPFSLIISVTDLNATGSIYDRIETEFKQLVSVPPITVSPRLQS